MFRNKHYLSIQQVKGLFETYLDRIESWDLQVSDVPALQLDVALANIQSTSFKVIHPIFMQGYKTPTMKFRNEPLRCVGLDIETNAETGEPKLLGFWYPEPYNRYEYLFNPKLSDFFKIIRGLSDNTKMHLTAWGKLDLQAIMRLFNPDEIERERLSRGLSANVKDGRIIGTPPVMRTIGKAKFYIAHYIDGRSLKLGILDGDFETTIWIFNCRQFYPGTIPQTAKGLGLQWIDFSRNTHIVDWHKFATNKPYRTLVLASNQQDAKTVSDLIANLQQRFNDVFDCYPALLVSTGSLTDAAVGKMLSDNVEDYRSNSWRWLCQTIWQSPEITAKCETLLSECFSAGWVDQFAIGYFSEVSTADIAAAYPHKIRALPDLRYAILITGENNLESDIEEQLGKGREVETAFIRGKVTIPETLKFHPITVKTRHRENIRPTGTFYAGYTLDERRWCERYGATFTDEQYFIVSLTERRQASIGRVSEKLGVMRAEILKEQKTVKDRKSDRWRLLDGQQYLVKVIDNSIYGKTVMTTEVVEDIDGRPMITGYVGGDRFNLLYGTLITARTRIQLAEACMQIKAGGGKPIITMTDSIYWHGEKLLVPLALVRNEKTPGYFEPPETVYEMFVLKTGQYEYRDDKGWHFKRRGLPIVWQGVTDVADDESNEKEMLSANRSFYRSLIQEHCATLSPHKHPKDIRIPLHTRRLITIGHKNLSRLASLAETTTDLKPFVLSSKSVEKFVLNWPSCINSHLDLKTPHLNGKANPASGYPLSFLTQMFESNVVADLEIEAVKFRTSKNRRKKRAKDWKRAYIWFAIQATKLPPPPGDSLNMSWEALLSYFGIPPTDLLTVHGWKGIKADVFN